jgi:Ca2+-binding EF-hand superfamily protein
MKFTTLKLATLALVFFAISTSEAQEKKAPNFEKMLKRFDSDENGSISLEEFKSAKRKKEVAPKKLEKNFAKIDANSDGKVTLEELQSNWDKRKKKKKR